jgi:hypothetical protein
MELRPTHDALRHVLDPALVRALAELAEQPRAAAGSEKQKNIELQKSEFFEYAWKRTQDFLRESQAAYASRAHGSRTVRPTDPALLAERFRECIRAAMHIPALESLFPTPWTAEARRVLPSDSPQLTATAMWGPVLGWCVLELLAESIDAENQQRTALDLFDRLRLREPLAQSFAALGFEGEESWRVAARMKVALLVEARVAAPDHPGTKTPSEKAPKGVSASAANDVPAKAPAEHKDADPVLSPALWHDPDVRWLTGVHEAQGHSYFSKESYEELLWWLQLPALRELAGEATPNRSAIAEISKTVREALAAAAAAGYRVDALLERDKPKADAVKAVDPAETQINASAANVPKPESDPAELTVEPTAKPK